MGCVVLGFGIYAMVDGQALSDLVSLGAEELADKEWVSKIFLTQRLQNKKLIEFFQRMRVVVNMGVPKSFERKLRSLSKNAKFTMKSEALVWLGKFKSW